MKSKWNYGDIPDLSGRIALVTGANSGLGYHTALGLASAGARVLLACRSLERAERAAAEIRRQLPAAHLTLIELDLADLETVSRCAATVHNECERLDILVNNAGLSFFSPKKTAQGFEIHFGVNHLGHFALTSRLLPLLLASDGSRVVNVSSLAHRNARLNFSDLQGKNGFDAYSLSKLANLLFTLELQKRLSRSSAATISVTAHPGLSATGLISMEKLREESNRFVARTANLVGRVLIPVFGQDAAQGALPQLYAAAAPGVIGGDYYGPDGWQEFRGFPRKIRARDHAYDEEAAARLWQVSSELTGESFAQLASQ
ncbi:MAG: oxidoreductase [Caldilineaceae bacterium]|nr:oxidoreductase [Caldilineaceae bacterium]MCY4116654.1 oxidoreductase [Caldilineaceae bacterium]